jgi:5-methylcytosine-specific restriction endonuclease McrA
MSPCKTMKAMRQKAAKKALSSSGKKGASTGKRNYRKEYDEYHGTPEQRKNRAARNRARNKLGLKKGDPREVDHKTALDKGGGNGKKNLRAVSKSTNRKKYNK